MNLNYKKYFSYFLIFIFINIATVATFNFAVDSLGVFHSVRIEGFNAKKPQVVESVRQFKILSMDNYKPDAVIIGSSRTDRSLHPDFLEKNNYPLKYYNLSILGTDPREARRYLEHAFEVHRIKEAVIGLDFEMFNTNRDNSRKDILNEGLLSANADGSRNLFYSATTYFKFLLSMSGVENSLLTIKKQKRNTQRFKPNGAMEHQLNKKEFIKNGGVGGLLDELLVRYYKTRWTVGGKDFALQDDSGYSYLNEIKKMLDFALEKDIKIDFVITPVHAYFEEARGFVGLYDVNVEWKRGLARAVFNANSRLDGDFFTLWDFSGFNTVTEESFPAEGDRATSLKYFGDAVHMTKNTGELVLARVYGFNEPLVNDFGVLLNKSNVESHLESMENKREVFVSKNIKTLDKLSKLISNLSADKFSK